MSDLRSTLERELGRLAPPRISFDQIVRRRERKNRQQRIRAMVVGLGLAIALGLLGLSAIRSTPRTPGDDATRPPTSPVLRHGGEVLRFTGVPWEEPGDVVAVDPATGETRVLVEDLLLVHDARWSADGRWVAYGSDDGPGLWGVGAELEPRRLLAPDTPGGWAGPWTWSPTDARIALVLNSRLTVLDAASGDMTDLGRVVGDVTSAPVWSPDGTRILFGARGGSLSSVDVRSGERSLLASLPGWNLDSMDRIAWSPDGAHIAVVNDLVPGGGRLYLMNADGSQVRTVVDDYLPGEVAWSPDGTWLAYTNLSGSRIWNVSPDGSATISFETGAAHACALGECVLAWSPDGSMIAFQADGGFVSSAFAADGGGETVPIDELTFLSWSGGSYQCLCRE